MAKYLATSFATENVESRSTSLCVFCYLPVTVVRTRIAHMKLSKVLSAIAPHLSAITVVCQASTNLSFDKPPCAFRSILHRKN